VTGACNVAKILKTEKARFVAQSFSRQTAEIPTLGHWIFPLKINAATFSTDWRFVIDDRGRTLL
jgi:hypothetical protein